MTTNEWNNLNEIHTRKIIQVVEDYYPTLAPTHFVNINLTCPRSLVQHYESRVDSIESTGSSLAAAERRGGAPSGAAASRAA